MKYPTSLIPYVLSILIPIGLVCSAWVVEEPLWMDGTQLNRYLKKHPESSLYQSRKAQAIDMAGKVVVYSLHTANTAPSYHYAKAMLYDRESHRIRHNGTVSLNDKEFTLGKKENVFWAADRPLDAGPEEFDDHYAKEWFGTEVNIKIDDEFGRKEVERVVRIPALLNATFNMRKKGYLQAGDNIYWEKDENISDLLLTISYLPTNSTSVEDSPAHDRIFKVLKDSGSYTFSEEDIDFLYKCKEGELSLSLERSYFTASRGASSGRPYSMGGLHSVSQELELR